MKKNKEEHSEYVNSPAHYVNNGYECIDVLEAIMCKQEFVGFLRGNVIKYLYRYGKKDNILQEAKKAQWYLNKLVDTLNKDK